jgi:hypothetical protein
MPVPKGVDKKKHSSCERKLIDQGKDKVTAIKICNDSLRGKIKKK